MNVHQKPRAGILLEVDLSVRPESYYYYYYSTRSHKWWETLTGSIFVVKPPFPAPGSPEVFWWWILLRKRHSMDSQFDNKQCREQFVTPLYCFPQSRCNSLAFCICFLVLTHMVVVILWVCFLYF